MGQLLLREKEDCDVRNDENRSLIDVGSGEERKGNRSGHVMDKQNVKVKIWQCYARSLLFG